MALIDNKITDNDVSVKGVVAAPDRMLGTADENKRVFDRLIREAVKEKLNRLIDNLRELGVEHIIRSTDGEGHITYLRVGADGLVETSADGVNWGTTALKELAQKVHEDATGAENAKNRAVEAERAAGSSQYYAEQAAQRTSEDYRVTDLAKTDAVNARNDAKDAADRAADGAGRAKQEADRAADGAERAKEEADRAKSEADRAKSEAGRAGAAAATAILGETERATEAEHALENRISTEQGRIDELEEGAAALNRKIENETARATGAEEALDRSVAAKQDALTAGDNIVIEGNVISATGGMTPKEQEQMEKNTQDIENAYNGFVAATKSYQPERDYSKLIGDDLITARHFVHSGGYWAPASPTAQLYSQFIPAAGFNEVSVTARDEWEAFITFLKSTDESVVDFCDGVFSRTKIDAGSSAVLAVPTDCAYINVTVRATSTNPKYTPKEITLRQTNSGLINHEQRITALETTAADKPRSVIIGASIEAGTTHESSTSGAVVNPIKAYLTVALQRNGHEVTNLSHGGMGYLRTASSGGYTFKDIIDSTNFNDFDCCWISLGTNDWHYDFPLGTPDDDSSADTVCGRLKYGIEKIMQSNAYCKIYVKMPELRGYKDESYAATMWGWKFMNEAAVPYTQEMMEAAIEAVCSAYSVETYGRRGSSIVNVINLPTVLPDLTHPSVKTMALMADAMTGAIPFKRRG